MKRLLGLLALVFGLAIVPEAGAQSNTVRNMTENTSPATTYFLYCVHPSATPGDYKCTIANVLDTAIGSEAKFEAIMGSDIVLEGETDTVTPAMLTTTDTPADNECYSYDLATLTGSWVSCGGAGGGIVDVEEEDVTKTSSGSVIDFGAGFDVTDSPAGEANIVLDLTEDQVQLATEVAGTLPITAIGGTEADLETALSDVTNVLTDSENAATATALAANGANCSSGSYALGVDASGAVESCAVDDDVPDAGDFAAATDLDLNGAIVTDAIGTAELDDDANTPVAAYFVVVETGANSFDYVAELDSTMIGDDSILAAELADNSVASANIIAQTVDSTDIGDDAILAAEIAADAVGESELIEAMDFTGTGNWQMSDLYAADSLKIPHGIAVTAADCNQADEEGKLFIDTDEAAPELYICDGTAGWKLADIGDDLSDNLLTDLSDVGTVLKTGSTDSLAFVCGTVTNGNLATWDSNGCLVDGGAAGSGGDDVLVNAAAVVDGSGVDFQDGNGLSWTLATGTSPDGLTVAVDSLAGDIPIRISGHSISTTLASLSPNGDDDYTCNLDASNICDLTLDGTGEVDSLFLATNSNIGDVGFTLIVRQPASPGDTVVLRFDATVFEGSPSILQDENTITYVSGIWRSADSKAKVNSDEEGVTTTDIQDGTIANADISGSAAIDISKTALVAGRSLTISTNTVDVDAELYTDTECIYIEDPTASDDFNSIDRNSTATAWTLTEIWAESDQTVNFDLQIDDGTPADVNGTDISPAAGEAEDTTLSGDTELAVDEELDLAITSVSGTPTWVSICWTYTRGD